MIGIHQHFGMERERVGKEEWGEREGGRELVSLCELSSEVAAPSGTVYALS